MTDPLYEHILVPTDFRPHAREAYHVAMTLASASKTRVTLLHVVPVEPEEEYLGLDAIRLMHRAAEQPGSRWNRQMPLTPERQEELLQRLLSEIPVRWKSTVPLNVEVRSGEIVEEMSRFITEGGVDLVVMASASSVWARRFGTSTADQLARRTSVRILRVGAPARVKM